MLLNSINQRQITKTSYSLEDQPHKHELDFTTHHDQKGSKLIREQPQKHEVTSTSPSDLSHNKTIPLINNTNTSTKCAMSFLLPPIFVLTIIITVSRGVTFIDHAPVD